MIDPILEGDGIMGCVHVHSLRRSQDWQSQTGRGRGRRTSSYVVVSGMCPDVKGEAPQLELLQLLVMSISLKAQDHQKESWTW